MTKLTMSDETLEERVIAVGKKRNLHPVQYNGNADLVAQKAPMSVLALNTDDCRVQKEMRKVIPWRKDMKRVVETTWRSSRESKSSNQYINRVMDDCSCAWKMATSIVTRGLCVLEARDVKN